jgi:hypothetical protein
MIDTPAVYWSEVWFKARLDVRASKQEGQAGQGRLRVSWKAPEPNEQGRASSIKQRQAQ